MIRSLLKAIKGSKAINLETDKAEVITFRKRYASFRHLLDANAGLAEVMADIEEKLRGHSLFGLIYLRNIARNAVVLTRNMAKSLNEMRPGMYAELISVVDEIEKSLSAILGGNLDEGTTAPAIPVIPFSELDISLTEWVGGKSANLGEMQSMAGMPVPAGFAVTTAAYYSFITYNGLAESIEKTLSSINPEDREELNAILENLRKTIEEAPFPPSLSASLKTAVKTIFPDENKRIAVRSSALAEDGEKSFAGQFLSLLGILPKDVEKAYKQVVASLFTPSATLYRMHQGIALKDSPMAVACVSMINSVVSGVAYSHDPVRFGAEAIVINGIYGLGSYLVEGVVTPDTWIFSRTEPPQLVRKKKGSKERQLLPGENGIPYGEDVSLEKQNVFCMDDAKAQELANMILHLEKHFGCYQDVEWGMDPDGKLWLLQSRPLAVNAWKSNRPDTPRPDHAKILMDGGEAAYQGIGFGPVVIPTSMEDLAFFPKDGVLVTRHSSPGFASVMDRAQAIITETGGITGHMATLAREYRIPTLMNMPGVLQRLKPGMEVTVDAFAGRVYSGIIEELLPLREFQEPVRLLDTPVYKTLRQASSLIIKLNLIDPSSADFSPKGCKTLHDVMRYAHEMSYQEMFAISDTAADAGGVAMKLEASLPIDLYLIDLDSGTTAEKDAHYVTPEQIISAPLLALLQGMLNPKVIFRKPRPINMGGFMSVMSQQIVNPKGGNERFGDKSYAIISDRYMNFSSRVGYHYSVLDAYCGNTISKNYISFTFQGGAAGEERRIRRCKAIALVLEELGFTVHIQGDTVKSRLQKYPKKIIEERLDQLGRLLQVTRQMDMLMVDDTAIAQFKENFMNEVYY